MGIILIQRIDNDTEIKAVILQHDVVQLPPQRALRMPRRLGVVPSPEESRQSMTADRISHPPLMKAALAGTFLALAAVVALALLLSSPGAAVAQSSQELCENEVVVENPQENPGLVADCAALLASKEALQGSDSDAMPLNWSSDVPIGDWNGITVEGSPPRVTKLRFSDPFASVGNDQLWDLKKAPFLKGSIPPELGDLSMLEELHLSYNSLSGGIPKQLGKLRNLTQLDLSHNQLSGGIPRQLGKLSNLEQLLLNTNSLEGGIPKQLGNLGNLRQLWLKENNLEGGIPSELGNLTDLTVLWLDVKNLEGGVPPELDEFRNRTEPWLNNDDVHVNVQPRTNNYSLLFLAAENQPENLGNLANTRYLWLYRNQAPIKVLGMGSYQVLGGNGDACVFGHLIYLDVEYPPPGNLADILGLPWCDETPPTAPTPTPQPEPTPTPAPDPCDETDGAIANVDNNGVVPPGCDIPEETTPEQEAEPEALPATEPQSPRQMCESGEAVPDAANNPGLVSDCATLLEAKDTLAGSAQLNWSADIPMEAWDGVAAGGEPLRVTQLDLSGQGLDGSVPAGLGDLSGLVRLYFNGNSLSGGIPGELGNLAALGRLRLDGNQLDGPIPPQLGNLPSSEPWDWTTTTWREASLRSWADLPA